MNNNETCSLGSNEVKQRNYISKRIFQIGVIGYILSSLFFHFTNVSNNLNMFFNAYYNRTEQIKVMPYNDFQGYMSLTYALKYLLYFDIYFLGGIFIILLNLPQVENFFSKKFNINLSTPEKLYIFVFFTGITYPFFTLLGINEIFLYPNEIKLQLINLSLSVIVFPCLLYLSSTKKIAWEKGEVFIFMMLLSFPLTSVISYYEGDFTSAVFDIAVGFFAFLIFIPGSPIKKYLWEKYEIKISINDELYFILSIFFMLAAFYGMGKSNNNIYLTALFFIFSAFSFLNFLNNTFHKTCGFDLPLRKKTEYTLLSITIIAGIFSYYGGIKNYSTNQTIINELGSIYEDTMVLATRKSNEINKLIINKNELLNNKTQLKQAEKIYLDTYIELKNIQTPLSLSPETCRVFNNLQEEFSQVFIEKTQAVKKLSEYVEYKDEKSYMDGCYINELANCRYERTKPELANIKNILKNEEKIIKNPNRLINLKQ
ncbi:MAG: hypothetical protein WCK67_12450 [bacterium]